MKEENQKTDQGSASQIAPLETDIDDIGKLLGCLLDEHKRKPSELVKLYLTDDLKRLRPDFPERAVTPGKTVENLFEFTLLPGLLVHRGGSGIVFEVANPLIKSLHYALKIDRPSLYQPLSSDSADPDRKRHAEFLRHGTLSHENIARVYGPGTLHVQTELDNRRSEQLHLDAILMEWIENAVPLNAYIVGRRGDSESILKNLVPRQIVGLLIQSFDALSHLHNNNLIHWDLKSDNLLVNGEGVVKLMDIGNARRTDDSDLSATSTRGHMPNKLEELIKEEDLKRPQERRLTARTSFSIPDATWNSPWLDMWMLARELYELFEPDLIHSSTRLGRMGKWSVNRTDFLDRTFPVDGRDERFVLQFIRLVLQRLLKPETPSVPRYYEKASEVANDLRKLEPEFGSAQNIHELWAVPQRIMRMPASGNAVFTPRIAKLFNCSPIRRLSQHLQLGSIAHVYPGATHRRSEHVAGVLATACEYVRALYSDQTDPFWRISIDEADIKALFLAALTHDVGHIAFGHYLEELGGLFRGRTHEDYAVSVLDSKRRFKPPLKFGASTQDAIARDREIIDSVVRDSWATDDTGDTPDAVMKRAATILRPLGERAHETELLSRFVKGDSERLKLHILHSILDSAIDADKLDYLIRDAHHCGVEYPKGIDLDRFFQALTTFSDASLLIGNSARRSTERNSRDVDVPGVFASIAVTDKGLLPVESILIARYQMFRSVYWHHTARAETAMLHFLVTEYVGQSRDNIENRLDSLLDHFRESSDRDALMWLRQQVGELVQQGTRSNILENICDGLLGNRTHLYHEVFSLRYECDDSTRPRQAEEIYEMFADRSKKWDKITEPYEYIETLRALRKLLAAKISDQLGPKVEFDHGDVLVDVPPARKDQVENIFVYRNNAVHPVQDLSPIANAVRDAFRLWARDFRIFLSREALKRCEAGDISVSAIEDACWQSVQSLDPQAVLPLPES